MPDRALLLAALLIALALPACGGSDAPLEPDSEEYREAVSAFYAGLAGIEAGSDVFSEEKMLRVTELAPREPAAWANLGVLAMRRNNIEEADARLARARELAPGHGDILVLSGLLESLRGDFEAAIAYLRRAIEVEPENVRAKYALAELLERQGGEGSEAEVQQLLQAMLETRPENLAILLELARVAARTGDADALRSVVDRLGARAPAWPEEVRDQFETVQAAVEEGATAQAATQIAFLRNVLLRVPQFRQDLAAVQTPADQVGELIQRFLFLPSPQPAPAAADDSLGFIVEPLPAEDGAWAMGRIVTVAEEGPPVVLLANATTVQLVGGPALPYPGDQATAPGLANVEELDYDYDFQMDLAFAGPAGLRLYRNEGDFQFTEVTASLGLPASVTQAAYTGVWAIDLDSEGDLDLVLGTPVGPPRVLRNQGDGTFEPIDRFGDAGRLVDLGWADLDGDGDPDAALLTDDGTVRVYVNERAGAFRPAAPAAQTGVGALAVADVNADATVDLVLFRDDGAVVRLSGTPDGNAWDQQELARWDGLRDAPARLFVQDLDNNGALDLLASTDAAARVWLGTADGFIPPRDAPIDVPVYAVVDLTGEGRLDLLAIGGDGRPQRLVSVGTKAYNWYRLRVQAAEARGDQRINPFGIGGEVELRAGLVFQKQPITEPVLHFGLGDNLVADVARITWPNGDVQAEFDLLSGQVLSAQQRLKGSCPWLFTFDGESMRFVTDFLWRSPLGLRINAQETAGIMATEDWVRIPGDALVPREDGRYDLRITAELWETHFFDHVSLLVVDHPESTEVFVDERFAFPPPPHELHPLTPLRPVEGAWDEQGADVSATVAALDEDYLGTFARGQYQGVAEEHYVEIALPAAMPEDAVLVGQGWVRPTDSSINVALSQGDHAPPRSLRLDVPDGAGGWTTARENLGFPSGKTKTVLLDLEGVFRPGTPRRLRLVTNLEVYWDRLAWAVPQPREALRVQRLAPDVADLRYRGYSDVTIAGRNAPEIPHYDRLEGTAPRWRDLVGYYTRHGDVRELLGGVDDRYVIMNAGDELVFRFAAPEPPPEGWARTFVLVGDGWVKDGDLNTGFSKTVLPLPAHDQPEYDTPPARLEDDPVYQRYPDDWRRFHTRYVTPRRFHEALVPRRVPTAVGR